MPNIMNISTLNNLSHQSVKIRRNETTEAVSLAGSLPREILKACVKMGIEDHKAGRCISHNDLMAQIREKRGWK